MHGRWDGKIALGIFGLLLPLLFAMHYDQKRLIVGDRFAQTDNQCSADSIEFIRLLLYAPDGGYLFPPQKSSKHSPWHCSNSNFMHCRFDLLRHYLPTSSWYLDKVARARSSGCDLLFSDLMSHWLTTTYTYRNHTSVAYLTWTNKVSLGKYIRFAASLQYRVFSGSPKDTLINFFYDGPSGWPWADTVKECKGPFENWNCAFAPIVSPAKNLSSIQWMRLSALVSSFEMTRTNFTINSLLNAPTNKYSNFDLGKFRDIIFGTRLTKPNHIVQMLLYAKHLHVLARPSLLAKRYLVQNVVSLYSHNWGRSTLHPKATIEKFNTYEEFLAWAQFSPTAKNANLKKVPLSLSLQVRQGDSCDLVLEAFEDKTTHLWARRKSQRACYSVDVYMKKLHELAKRYPIKRIFLATDSAEMIDRVYKEPQFNWVFLNISRAHFDKSHGWIEKRLDGDNSDTLFSSVVDMHLLQFGDIMMGSMASTFAKVGYYLMVGHHLRVIPFFSLDYPLACETADPCDFDVPWSKQDLYQLDLLRREKNSNDSRGQNSSKISFAPSIAKTEQISEPLDRKAARIEHWLQSQANYFENSFANPINAWTWTNVIIKSWYCRLGQRYPPLWWNVTNQCCVSEHGYMGFNITEYSSSVPLAGRNCTIVSN